ncbi:MAG: hypothetical protein WA705_30205 [Candidatus Ozemobacteraceae bacterium]
MNISAASSQPFQTASQLMNSAADTVQTKPLSSMLQMAQAKNTTEIGAKLQKIADEMLGTILDMKA